MGFCRACIALSIWLIAGCDHLFPYSAGRSGSDGTQDRASPREAAPHDAGCWKWGPFLPDPVLANVNSTSDEWDPFVTADGLTLMFSSWRPVNGVNSQDLWISTRANASVSFSPPQHLEDPGLNTPAREARPFLTRDGLTLYFSSTRTDGNDMDIFRATRPSLSEQFVAPQPVSELNSSTDWDLMGSLSPDELTIYFTSARDGKRFATYTAQRQRPTGVFFDMKRLTVANAPLEHYVVSLSPDGTELFLTARPSSAEWADLWLSRQDPSTGLFSGATPIGELNTQGDDGFASLAGDGMTLYYVKDTSIQAGPADISVARRACLPDL